MFCPECKAEYREGFYECADCGVALVYRRPEEGEPSVAGLSMLFRTVSPEELGDLVEALESAGIAYLVHAGTAMAVARGEPLAGNGRPGHWEAVVWVPAAVVAKAGAVLQEVRQRRASGTPPSETPVA